MLSRYLRQAVDEEAFTPIWPNRTARLTKRDARTAVTLIREDLLRGVEFDTVVISELDEVIDDVSSPSYRIALYRAVASSRGEVHLTWFREGGADALSNSINGIELPQA
ncbi:hypothetical protein RE9431_17180 [Prescottella equi]|nr:hypothetical protein RE9431_17180 [Prescottella equi]BCN73115.1 hypothetical protein RE0327_17140 [Prescottella equi]